MTTAIKRRVAFDPVTTFKEHLENKAVAATISGRAETLKKRLKEWISGTPEEAYQNENGSLFVDLDETIEVAGVKYKGMELRRAVSVTFNEGNAGDILRKKTETDPSIFKDACSYYVDQDKVHRLVAEGRLTEADLDAMFEEKESFSFWPVKGEVV